MKWIKLITTLFVLFGGVHIYAQTAVLPVYSCENPGVNAITSGLKSSNFLQGIIPSCTVTVYLTGTTNKATIYKNSSNLPQDNPFKANTNGSIPPIYADNDQAYDVTLSAGIPPNTYTNPVTLTGVQPGGGGSGSGVSQIIPGENVTCSPNVDGSCIGVVTINSNGGSGGTPFGGSPGIPYALTPSTSRSSVAADYPSATNSSQGMVQLAAGVVGNIIAKVASTGDYNDLNNKPATVNFVSRGILALYTFGEGAGAMVIHDTSGANSCSGAPCDITLTGAGTDPVMTVQGLDLIQVSNGSSQQTFINTPSLPTGIRSVTVGMYVPPLANGEFIVPANWGATCTSYWTWGTWTQLQVQNLSCDGGEEYIQTSLAGGGPGILTRPSAGSWAAEPQVRTYTLGNNASTDLDHIYINGAEANYTLQGASLSAGSLGGVLTLGNETSLYPSFNTGFPGVLPCLAIYSVELTQAEAQQNTAACNALMVSRGIPSTPYIAPSIARVLACSGDSIFSDIGMTDPICKSPMAGLNDSTIVSYPNGLPSWTSQDIQYQVPFREALLFSPLNEKAYAVEESGENNYALGQSTTEIVQGKVALAQALRAAGAKRVFMTTIISRQNSMTDMLLKDEVNPLVRAAAEANGFGLIDFASYPNIGADGAATNPTYFLVGDAIHPTQLSKTDYMIPAIVNNINEYEGSNLHGCGVTSTPVTTSTYSEVAADSCLRADAASNNVAITMVQCNGYSQPRNIKNATSSGSNTVTVAPFSGDLIDGSASAITVALDGTLTLIPRVVDSTGVCHWEQVSNSPQAGGGGSGTVTSVTSADANATVASSTTTPVITIVAAPKLATARNINGVSFDGTAAITVPAAAETLTGTTLPALIGTELTALNATNITIGTIPAAQLPLATTGAFGAVKCDGTTITCTAGVIASVGSGTVTHTVGALTASDCVIGNGAGDIKVDPSCSLDGSGNETLNSVTTAGTTNGSFTVTFTGTPATAPTTNQFQISPAVAVTTPWSLSPAAAPASGYIKGINTAGVVQQSFESAINLASGDVTGLLGNANLANPSTTVNGTVCTLGSTCTVSASSTAFQSNGTPLTSSTTVNFVTGIGNGGVVVSNPSAGNVNFNLSKPFGAGANFTTGTATSVAGNIPQFGTTDGSIQDSLIPATDLERLSTNQVITGQKSIQNFNICIDTSGSGTAQSCTTTGGTFTPVTGSCVVYATGTANTGAGLTLNVNSLGAKSVAKWLGTTTLAAGDVAATSPQLACYNGTVWNLSTIGNAPSGGGSGTVGTGIIDGVAYYTGTTTTGSITPPTTTGNTFFVGYQPSGSAVAPTAINLATYLASPAAIGGTSPAAGAFTTGMFTGNNTGLETIDLTVQNLGTANATASAQQFRMENGAFNPFTAAKIGAVTITNTSTAETADLYFFTRNAGTLAEKLRLTGAGDLNIELGHLTFAAATPPAVTSCGSGTIATGSTDNVFSITGVTAATGCTVTFNRALKQGVCTVSTNSTSIPSSIATITTTAVTFGMALFTGSLYAICF